MKRDGSISKHCFIILACVAITSRGYINRYLKRAGAVNHINRSGYRLSHLPLDASTQHGINNTISRFDHIRKGCPVSYTHLRAHETRHDLVCRLLLEKKKK